MMEILWKSTLLLAISFAVRALIRKGRPELRHLVSLVALVSVLMLPVAPRLFTVQAPIAISREREQVQPERAQPLTVSSSVSSSPRVTAKVEGFEIPWSAIAFRLWMAGSLAILLRYAFGLAALVWLRRFGSDCATGGNQDGYQLRFSRRSEPATAMTWGVFQPIILLPLRAVTWSRERLDCVLMHELAHVERRDFVSQMLAELACAAYWFNPLVWLIARALREDAELAADSAVLNNGIRPSDYAAELLQIAMDLGPRRQSLSRIGVSAMTTSKIESRLNAVLKSTSHHKGMTSIQLLITAAFGIVAVSAIASVQVQEVGTPDPSSEKTLAMSRLKQTATATLFYTGDYDDVFPYVTSTPDARTVVMPYAKDKTVFVSPRKGADFRFNMNAGGVDASVFPSPAEDLQWFEVTPNGTDPFVAFVDGHVKVIGLGGRDKLAKSLKERYRRVKTMKPIKMDKH